MDGENEIKKAYASILDADFEQAIEWFEQAVQLDPGNADYHYKLSVTYARSNRLEKAICHALQASTLQPEQDAYRFHYDILMAKMWVLCAEKQMEGAEDQLHMGVTMLRRAIELDPLSADAHLLLAVAYDSLQEYALALKAVKDALKLEPHHAEANRLHAELERKLRRLLRS